MWYHVGFSGFRPFEATNAYLPSCSTPINGVLRSLPDFAPTVARMMIGRPVGCWTFTSLPPVRSYSATWLATYSFELGSYSPVRGMLRVNPATSVLSSGSGDRAGGNDAALAHVGDLDAVAGPDADAVLARAVGKRDGAEVAAAGAGGHR